jgi:hypothetical protein
LGVLCPGPRLRAWERECLRHLLTECDEERISPPVPGVDLGLVVVDDAPSERPSLGRRLRGLARRHALYHLYRRYRFRPEAMRTVDASDLLAGAPTIRCRAIVEGHSQYFTAEDVERIRGFELDVILRFGFNIIHGDILDAARFGVWSFHHGDERRYRGQPAAFWEIFHGDRVTGAILQRLTDRLDAGVVLRRGTFKTLSYSYVANRQQALAQSVDWPAQVCKDIRRGDTRVLEAAPSATVAPIYTTPTNRQMLRFGMVLLRNYVAVNLARGLWRDTWNIGRIDRPIHSLLSAPSLEGAQWIADDGREWLADPFPLSHDGRDYLLGERWGGKPRRGRIVSLELGDGMLSGWASPRSALDLPQHASYPFVLEHGGAVFCVPETHEADEIALYRALAFPARWEKAAVLLAGVAGVDPTIIRHEGLWWLFFGDARCSDTVRLYLAYASDLMGPWTRHPGNPIKIDVRSARPAGTPFRHDGRLYRPAQDCSLTYGGRIVVNHVTRLTTTDFAEEPIVAIEPDPRSPYRHGLHTLSAHGEVTFIDGKRLRLRGKARP